MSLNLDEYVAVIFIYGQVGQEVTNFSEQSGKLKHCKKPKLDQAESKPWII